VLRKLVAVGCTNVGIPLADKIVGGCKSQRGKQEKSQIEALALREVPVVDLLMPRCTPSQNDECSGISSSKRLGFLIVFAATQFISQLTVELSQCFYVPTP